VAALTAVYADFMLFQKNKKPASATDGGKSIYVHIYMYVYSYAERERERVLMYKERETQAT
jgi:hypothetical protein